MGWDGVGVWAGVLLLLGRRDLGWSGCGRRGGSERERAQNGRSEGKRSGRGALRFASVLRSACLAASGWNRGFLTRKRVDTCGSDVRLLRLESRLFDSQTRGSQDWQLSTTETRTFAAAAALLHQAADRSACSFTEATSLHQRIHLLASS
jgi:hypothetical protein